LRGHGRRRPSGHREDPARGERARLPHLGLLDPHSCRDRGRARCAPRLGRPVDHPGARDRHGRAAPEDGQADPQLGPAGEDSPDLPARLHPAQAVLHRRPSGRNHGRRPGDSRARSPGAVDHAGGAGAPRDHRARPSGSERAGAEALHPLAARADGRREEPQGEGRGPQEGRGAAAQRLAGLGLHPAGGLADLHQQGRERCRGSHRSRRPRREPLRAPPPLRAPDPLGGLRSHAGGPPLALHAPGVVESRAAPIPEPPRPWSGRSPPRNEALRLGTIGPLPGARHSRLGANRALHGTEGSSSERTVRFSEQAAHISERIVLCATARVDGSGFGATRMRTSSAFAPSPRPARNGLMSSSWMRGWLRASWARRRSTSTRRSRSAPGSPRTPSSSLKPRMPRIMSLASPAPSGRTPKRTSWKTSTYLPPRPNIRRGPKRGSVVMPKITSWPPRAISWTSQPAMRCPPPATDADARSSAAASSVSLRRSTWTAPTSLLWTRSGATALRT